MTSSLVLPYPEALVTVAQREALRPQIVAAPLDVPFNPAAHRVGSPVPCLNHFFAGRGRLDGLMPCRFMWSATFASCLAIMVQFCFARSRSKKSAQSTQTMLPSVRRKTSSFERLQLSQRKPFSTRISTSDGFILQTPYLPHPPAKAFHRGALRSVGRTGALSGPLLMLWKL
jgi:hypothetical protein